MSNEIIAQSNTSPVSFSQDKIQLLKDTVCKGSTNEEFQLFVHACQRTGLDPFMRQIYSVKRWDSNLKREAMTIQTGIDGYRLIADRSGCYAPGKEAVFTYDANGHLISATAFVKKRTSDGTWHEISSTAFFEEFCQRTKEGKPMAMWAKMPHVMLSKVAESLCLRKAFPAELSGIYTKEEMDQSQSEDVVEIKQEPKRTVISAEQVKELDDLIGEDTEYRKYFMQVLAKRKINSLEEIPEAFFADCMKNAKANFERKQLLTEVSETTNI